MLIFRSLLNTFEVCVSYFLRQLNSSNNWHEPKMKPPNQVKPVQIPDTLGICLLVYLRQIGLFKFLIHSVFAYYNILRQIGLSKFLIHSVFASYRSIF